MCNYKIEVDMGIQGVIDITKSMSAAERSLFPEVIKVARIVLVVSAINSISERSFSAMCQVKTYLRSTMMQKHLNALMLLLHVHKEQADPLDLKYIAKEFCEKRYRQNKFPKVLESLVIL